MVSNLLLRPLTAFSAGSPGFLREATTSSCFTAR